MLKLKLQYFGHLMLRVDSLERLWCWEGLGAGGEGDIRGWDGWMASPTRWTWVWVNSRSWWWTGRPGVLRFMGSQRVRHDWATELNWTEGLSWAQQRIGHYTILLEMRKKDDSNETITPFSRSPNSIVLLVLQCLGHFLFTLKKMHLCHICHDQNRLQLNLRQI